MRNKVGSGPQPMAWSVLRLCQALPAANIPSAQGWAPGPGGAPWGQGFHSCPPGAIGTQRHLESPPRPDTERWSLKWEQVHMVGWSFFSPVSLAGGKYPERRGPEAILVHIALAASDSGSHPLLGRDLSLPV